MTEQGVPWFRLDPVWEGGEEIIAQGLPSDQVSPIWQLLLLADGSPTRHLQLLTGESIEVDIIDMSPIGMSADNAPELIHMLPGPRIRRQVWLRTATGQRLAYATSWWEESHVDEYLKNRSLPIWASLALSRTELFRDVRGTCRRFKRIIRCIRIPRSILGAPLFILASGPTNNTNL